MSDERRQSDPSIRRQRDNVDMWYWNARQCIVRMRDEWGLHEEARVALDALAVLGMAASGVVGYTPFWSRTK